MDPPYTPYEDLPATLQREMQLLQRYKDLVNQQVRRVVDVAVTEWQKADKRVAVQTAAQSREEQQAKDRATCTAATRKRKTTRANERAEDWASFVAA